MEIYVLFGQLEDGPEIIHSSTDSSKLVTFAVEQLAEFREEMGEGELCIPDNIVGGDIVFAFGNDYGNGDVRDMMTIEKTDVI